MPVPQKSPEPIQNAEFTPRSNRLFPPPPPPPQSPRLHVLHSRYSCLGGGPY